MSDGGQQKKRSSHSLRYWSYNKDAAKKTACWITIITEYIILTRFRFYPSERGPQESTKIGPSGRGDPLSHDSDFRAASWSDGRSVRPRRPNVLEPDLGNVKSEIFWKIKRFTWWIWLGIAVRDLTVSYLLWFKFYNEDEYWLGTCL